MDIQTLMLVASLQCIPVSPIHAFDIPLVNDAKRRLAIIIGAGEESMKDQVPFVIELGQEKCIHFINTTPALGGDSTFCYSTSDAKFTRQFLEE